MSIFASIVAILSILPYCYYASRITDKIQNMAYIAFDSCWYELRQPLQRNIQLIIEFAQIKRTVDGYNLFSCDLEGFVKVRLFFIQSWIDLNFHSIFVYF